MACASPSMASSPFASAPSGSVSRRVRPVLPARGSDRRGRCAARGAAIAQVFGAGALAGFAAPLVAVFADRRLASPFVGTAFAAALAQVAVLTLAMLSSRRADNRPADPQPAGAKNRPRRPHSDCPDDHRRRRMVRHDGVDATDSLRHGRLRDRRGRRHGGHRLACRRHVRTGPGRRAPRPRRRRAGCAPRASPSWPRAFLRAPLRPRSRGAWVLVAIGWSGGDASRAREGARCRGRFSLAHDAVLFGAAIAGASRLERRSGLAKDG